MGAFSLMAIDNESEITLQLLSMIEDSATVSQRSMASRLGIALGLANAYLGRCIRKGYVKISKVPAQRYAYYLTPHGFVEKSRLTAEFVSQSFSLFRQARTQYSDLLRRCVERDWTRVAFFGASDLTEIAVLCASELSLRPLAVIDDEREGDLLGLPVVRGLAELGEVDAVLITALVHPLDAFKRAAHLLPTERVLHPKLLRISLPRGTE